MDGADRIGTMLEAASAARRHAYAPYSGYAVGAAVLAESGEVFAGCNVENAAFPVGTCAEAGAVSAMVSAGGRRILAALVVAEGGDLVAPCGACRQRLMEFAQAEAAIHLATPEGIGRTCRIADLLPIPFGPGAMPTAPARMPA